jgi:hypothetical protein
MAIHPTLLLIADIGGYTRFMNLHRTSLAHAQEVVAQLLEAVIDATRGQLKLAKLEGDAAFFYSTYPSGAEPDLGFLAEQSATIFRAFHRRPRRSFGARLSEDFGRVIRSLPALLGITEACRDFRNIDRTPAG